MSTIDIGIAETVQRPHTQAPTPTAPWIYRKPTPPSALVPQSTDFYVGSVKLESPAQPSTYASNASAGTGLLNR